MKSICIVGSGTAGLVAGLIYRATFPNIPITTISSSAIGIVGVGEGSTEHWKTFMSMCNIPVAELLVKTDATHKMGIRFEGWTNHTPDYFHSVSLVDNIQPYGIYGIYCGIHDSGKLLTNSLSHKGMIQGKVRAENPHESLNQFHFDTNKLNSYLTELCIQRNIRMIDGIVETVQKNIENGNIESITLQDGSVHAHDIYIDASGFNRILMNAVGNTKWRDFKKFLPMDSAIAFPTDLPEDKVINPFTRAVAKSSGWMWEIPTQQRRGNGYVFSSDFLSEDEAIKEASDHIGYEITPLKTFRFNAGCLDKLWYKNVIAIGLASVFVEPLEATSIGSTIVQIISSARYLTTFEGSQRIIDEYNSKMRSVMDNLCAMISLHYITDRNDTEFWKFAQTLEKPEYLQNLLDLWQVTTIGEYDIVKTGFELFYAPHFWHVAQGQGVLPRHLAGETIRIMGVEQRVKDIIWEKKQMQSASPLVDHLESLLTLRD